MALVIKSLRNVGQSSGYAELVVSWCSANIGPRIESSYHFDNTSHIPRDMYQQEAYEAYVEAVATVIRETGISTEGISDVEMHRGEGWWHFDCDIKSVMVNVTVLPDDATAVLMKLAIG